jgi:hypothetical protein
LRWSMGLMGTRGSFPPLYRGERGRKHFHPRRPKRASFPRASLESLPCPARLAGATSAPAALARRQRTGGPRGVVGEPLSLNKAGGRFNNPRVRSPPASFATAHQQSVGIEAILCSWAREGGRNALAPAPTTPFRTLT